MLYLRGGQVRNKGVAECLEDAQLSLSFFWSWGQKNKRSKHAEFSLWKWNTVKYAFVAVCSWHLDAKSVEREMIIYDVNNNSHDSDGPTTPNDEKNT